ncbi:hypothetical protein BX600DRAFT_455167 [Xylariales sp. PMI_506]|nr:hypothetical protein BX600DRAFT_455167 [Xylariales sp. PMI_506]
MVVAKRDLFPNIVKDRAELGQIFGYVADLSGNPEEVSFRRLLNAVDRAAWFIRERLPEDVKVFAWMAKNDFRYTVWMIAAAKAGKIVAFPSLKNAPAANVALLSNMGATTLLYGPESQDILRPHLDAVSKTTQLIPAFDWDQAMNDEPVQPFPYSDTYESSKDKHFVAIHTSGTSGNPKPLYLSASYFKSPALFESYIRDDPKLKSLFPSWFDEEQRELTMFSIFPLNHFGGLFFTSMSLGVNMKLAIPHPDVPLVPENLIKLMIPSFDFFCIVPAILRSMIKHEECVERLRHFKYILSSGAPMEESLGTAVAAINPRIQTAYATSEIGAPPFIRTDVFKDSNPNFFNTVHILPSGHRFEEVIPGSFELVIPRTKETEYFYCVFNVLPDIDEFRTKDLFVPVPGHPDAWIYTGRRDDLIALANGLKYDPVPMENEIATHPDVRDALVAGEYRFSPCLIIDMMPGKVPQTAEQREETLHALWPTIEQANRKAAKYGKVPRELILFTTVEKEFQRTAKMSIKRKLTVALFEPEIEALYEQNEAGLLTKDLPPITELSAEGITGCLLKLYADALNSPQLGDDDDLLAQGIDSFTTAIIQTRIKAALRPILSSQGSSESKLDMINARLLYGNRSVRSLAGAVSALLGAANGHVSDHGQATNDSSIIEIERLLEEFEPLVRLPRREVPTKTAAEPAKVIVTGTTGSIGTYLLAALLAKPSTEVAHVFCLNRDPRAGVNTQNAALRSRGLAEISDRDGEERVSFITIDAGSPRLGLGEETWEQLRGEASLIVHNAWQVNFLLPVPAFRGQIGGLAELLALAHSSPRGPEVLFVSSVGVAGGDPWGDGTLREEIHHRSGATLRQGYAQSKYIGERLIEAYVSSSGLPAAVLRVGQVAGPVKSAKGSWNAQEWFPSLVRSSKFIGALPQQSGSLAYIDWIPVDELATVVLEIAGISDISGPKDGETVNTSVGGAAQAKLVFNVMNPNPTSYEALLPGLSKGLGAEIVPAEEWLDRLKESARKAGGVVSEKNPGVKLIDFYREEFLDKDGHMPKVATDNLLACSSTARSLPAVNDSWVELWLQQWQL